VLGRTETVLTSSGGFARVLRRGTSRPKDGCRRSGDRASPL